MKSILLFIALAWPVLSAWGGPQLLASINDPSGDDLGAGKLVYPQRSDFQEGDLDLLQLKVSRDDEGFWFEATMKNPIRDPAGVPNTVGGESLATFARKGFYQFNIDVYVDTDRIKGSGNTFTLPGRRVSIDPAYAWEKAVILTPRPELMHEQLLAVLGEQYPQRTSAEAEASVNQSMYFPTRIRVRDRTIAFFVPAAFFGGSDGTDWAVTALVTGAITSIPAGLTLQFSSSKPLERLPLGAMQPAMGHPADTFGYSGARPNPVVDMLGPSIEQQERELAAGDDLTGVSWGPHAANDSIAPSALASPEPESKPAAATMPTPPVPIGNLLQPEHAPAAAEARPAETRPIEAKPAAAAPAAAMPAETKTPADASVVKRLQTLQQLFDRKLIDESEYKLQKQRILNDL